MADYPDDADAITARLRAAGCVFAEEEAALLISVARDPADLAALVARRVAGEPVETIVGWASFCGLRIAVARGVFVPRRRTGLLVAEVLSIVQWQMVENPPDREPFPTGLSLVELCCGTAGVATAILDGMGTSGDGLEVHAADIDSRATACARENLGDRGQVHTGDLYDALPADLRGRTDLLVANAPYVPAPEIGLMPPEARDHEPRRALVGGPDGLEVQRRIIERAPEWLAPGGHLVVETSRRQSASTLTACERAGLEARVVTDDDLDGTAVVGRRP